MPCHVKKVFVYARQTGWTCRLCVRCTLVTRAFRLRSIAQDMSDYHQQQQQQQWGGGAAAREGGGSSTREERIARFLRAHTLTPLPALSAPSTAGATTAAGPAPPPALPTFKSLSALFLFDADIAATRLDGAAGALGAEGALGAAMRHYGLECWPAERLLPLMELYNALLAAGLAEMPRGQALARQIAAFYNAETAPHACRRAGGVGPSTVAPAPVRPLAQALPPALPPHLAAFSAVLMPDSYGSGAAAPQTPTLSPVQSPALGGLFALPLARESPPTSG